MALSTLQNVTLTPNSSSTGSIKWWSRGHRAHHRYTDTDLDPYSAQKGFWWSHIGWMIVKPRRTPGVADVSDLSANEVVKWQHRWYVYLIVGMGFVFPTLVAGLGWGDYRGGFFFAGAARLLFVHHVRPPSPLSPSLRSPPPTRDPDPSDRSSPSQSTFCVNSLAHWLGETPFDDKHSPRDHWITALVTVGEGYHNFVSLAVSRARCRGSVTDISCRSTAPRVPSGALLTLETALTIFPRPVC